MEEDEPQAQLALIESFYDVTKKGNEIMRDKIKEVAQIKETAVRKTTESFISNLGWGVSSELQIQGGFDKRKSEKDAQVSWDILFSWIYFSFEIFIELELCSYNHWPRNLSPQLNRWLKLMKPQRMMTVQDENFAPVAFPSAAIADIVSD